MKLLICTGGKGTRLRSVTNDEIPKTMVPINGKPVLEHLIEWAKKYGIKDIVMLNGHLSSYIEDYFGDGNEFGVNIEYSVEPYPLGSGGPIRYAAKYIDGPFVYISGDHICEVDLNDMIAFHKNNGADMTVLVHKSSHPWDSDILQLNENSKVEKFVSKHDDHLGAGDLSNSGLCIIEPQILMLMDKELFTFETYIYPKVLYSGMRMMGYQSEEFMSDMGTPERLKKCEDYLQSKNLQESVELMKEIEEVVEKFEGIKERVLVTGAGGMMGQHLLPMLKKAGKYEILGTYYRPTTNINELPKDVKIIELDIRDYRAVRKLMAEFRPDKILHLAAQSYPTVSLDDPWYTVDVNIKGTVNVFEAIREAKIDPIVLVACSSAEYGFVDAADVPIKESRALLPLHPYGVSKVAQDLLSYQYFKNYGIKTLRARIFNTTGPKKVNDVCADFTKQAVLIQKGLQEPVFRCGNLYTKRAITDVRDMIKGFLLLMDKGQYGEAYNISGDKVYEMQELFDKVCQMCNISPEIWQDPLLVRPVDEKIIYGDSTKLK
ncbi:MAG: GDP-mannose 4,6-dehydratase, partial [Nanoarchaeota archaeon]|nr:GDP-mannose 4,6-dehydratase [Nanoarchaeota archaeon]